VSSTFFSLDYFLDQCVLYLLVRHSTTFLLCFTLFFTRVSHFFARGGLRPGSAYLCFLLAGITGVRHQLVLLRWAPANFSPRLAPHCDLLISVFLVAEITGLRHHTQPWPNIFSFVSSIGVDKERLSCSSHTQMGDK
jgi:hypothetical protein